MKKNLMVVVAFVLIFTHIISPQNISFANDEVNECESMDFTVQTIKENDKKINGTAQSSQIIEIEFKTKNKTEFINVDTNGKYELIVEEEFLELNDVITISNDHFNIETKVVAEETPIKKIKSKQYMECPVDEPVEEERAVESMPGDPSEETAEEGTDEESELEHPSEETVEEGTDEESELENYSEEAAEERTDEESELEYPSEETVEEGIDEESELENQSEKSPKEFAPEKLNEEISERKLEDNKESGEIKNNDVGTFSVQLSQATQAVVANSEEFNNALSNENIEVIELSDNIVSSKRRNVNSNTGRKVINANGYNINMGSGHLFLTGDINEMTVRNAGLYTSNSDSDEGFFEKIGSDTNLHLENIKFNESNDSSGGKLGSNWEGEIHFYGKDNLINTRNGKNTLAFRKVFVHENANLQINHQSSGGALFFRGNILSYGDGEYGLEVRDNANVNINSNAAVMTSALFNLNSVVYRIKGGANVILSGIGDEIFDLDASMELHINNPNTVDLINRSNNRLFTNGRNIAFNIQQASVHGWKNNNWDNQSSHITPILNANFRFDGRLILADRTEIYSMTPEVPGFTSNFPPTMNRIMFDHSEAHILDLNIDNIRDTDTEIFGITVPDATVTMYNEKNNEIDTVTSDSSGEFNFILDETFEADDILRFKSIHFNKESETVEKTVIGNRLELINVPDSILFESTEIQDEEIIIERENPNMNVSVMDTRSNSNWYLTAKALSPLTDSDGNNPLDDALYYIDGNNEELIEDEAVSVGKKNQSSSSNVEELSWGADEGILLKLNPIEAKADTEYTTTIEWTLNDGP